MFRRIGRISRKNRQLIRERFAQRELARKLLKTRAGLVDRPLTYIVGLSLALVFLPSPQVRAECTNNAVDTITCDSNSPNPDPNTQFVGTGNTYENLIVDSDASVHVGSGAAIVSDGTSDIEIYGTVYSDDGPGIYVDDGTANIYIGVDGIVSGTDDGEDFIPSAGIVVGEDATANVENDGLLTAQSPGAVVGPNGTLNLTGSGTTAGTNGDDGVLLFKGAEVTIRDNHTVKASGGGGADGVSGEDFGTTTIVEDGGSVIGEDDGIDMDEFGGHTVAVGVFGNGYVEGGDEGITLGEDSSIIVGNEFDAFSGEGTVVGVEGDGISVDGEGNFLQVALGS
jgi:hypothetical protein